MAVPRKGGHRSSDKGYLLEEMSAAAVQSLGAQDPPEAASRLFAEHSERILDYCLRQLGSRPEAEDAVQTSFLYAIRALRRGVVPECESAWLTAIAKNVCHSQRRTVHRRGPFADDVELDTIALAQTGDDEEELLMGFKDALASMPEKQRRALVRREWQGVPAREIASELGMSATATHALLTRARHSFAHALTLPRRPVVGVVWLIVELRSHVKALLGGVSTKAAVTSIAVVGVGVGVGSVAVDRSLAEPKAPSIPTTALEQPTVPAPANTPTIRASSPTSVTPRLRSANSRNSRTGPVSRRGDIQLRRSIVPTEALSQADAPKTSEPIADTAPPAPKLPVDVPVDKPQLPAVEPPTQLLPPAEVPPLPTVDLPPVPPLPSADPPPVPSLPTQDPSLPGLPLP